MSTIDTFASATRMLAALETGEYTSVELLDAFLARIAEHSWVNAVVTLDAEGARVAAAEADAERAQGRLRGVLHGLPITVKDDVEVAGMRSTYGSLLNQDYVPEQDAPSVAALRAAGAIVFGRTNLPEFAADGQSYNDVHGTTSNPWDATRTPGGSSGGSAAALAAGMTALELGSDMGGSIRLPAAWCGVFGLKPTWGTVSLDGSVPTPGERSDPPGWMPDVVAAGPLARSAADLALALSVLATNELRPARIAGPHGLRVAAWLDDETLPTAHSTLATLELACEALAAAGAVVDTTARPALELGSLEELFELLFMADRAGGLSEDDVAAMTAHLNGMAADIPLLATHARALNLSHREWLALEQQRWVARTVWARFFEDWDVLVCPTVFTTAIEHDHSEPVAARRIVVDGAIRFHRPALTRWCGATGVGYLPSVSVPAGTTAEGLPVGIQVVAAEGADLDAIAVAALIEEVCGGFRRPPMRAPAQ